MTKTSLFFLTAVAAASIGCSKSEMPIKSASAGETNTSPSADSINARGHSLIRVINTVDGGQDVAVRLGEITVFGDVKSGVATDYTETATNIAHLSVRVGSAVD